MKRSEMILKLMEAMVEAPEDFEEAAEYLLTRIEKAGMQPPEIYVDNGTWYRDTGNYGYMTNEWEEEDQNEKSEEEG